MLPAEQPNRIHVAFDDPRLVANAGLLLPVILAQHLGLGELVDRHVDLGDAPGRANAGDKMLTLVASALAGGDCIDDTDVLRAGGTERVLGCVVKAPSTLGTFLRSFRWGHVRQLDRVSRELLARAWAAGSEPGDGPLTIDMDSTMCETYGLAKEGARRHNYSGQRGYHPLLAIAAGTGDVLMARLRQGRANTARGAVHFLRETVGRVRYAGATGPLTVRADSGFYTHAMVSVCRKMDVRYSITVHQHQRLRNLIEAIPEADWTPIPYWMDGDADVAEAEYTPFRNEPDAASVRLIVRRVKPTPGFQLALFTNYSYHLYQTALYVVWYNWIRPHSTLTKRNDGKPTTSAMAANKATRPFSLEDLVRVIDAANPPGPRGKYKARTKRPEQVLVRPRQSETPVPPDEPDNGSVLVRVVRPY